MAQIKYRAKLASNYFPLLSTLQGNTVIVPQLDQNYNRSLIQTKDSEQDTGIPQIYYGHNIIPTTYGYQSVAYINVINTPIHDLFFQEIIIIAIAPDVSIIIGYAIGSTITYVLRSDESSWRRFVRTSVITSRISYGIVGGIAYILIPGNMCYTYNLTANQFDIAVLTSLVIADIVGLTSYRSYLIAFSTTAVAWSSTIDPTDFTPSTITGAGGGDVDGLQGILVAALTHTLGFILYSTFNVIAAVASNNAFYPFIFTPIGGSSGISDSSRVIQDPTTSNHIQFSSRNIYSVTVKDIANIFENIAEFLSYNVFESFNEINNTFDLGLNTPLYYNITSASSRYLIVSYGIIATNYSYAIVVDKVLNRVGKLKFDHISIIDRNSQMSVITNLGLVYTLDTAYLSGEGSGLLILGKYKITRNNFITLSEVSVEGNSNRSDSLDITCIASNKEMPEFNSIINAQTGYNYKKQFLEHVFLYDFTGNNHSILIKGNFSLNSLELTFKQAGRR